MLSGRRRRWIFAAPPVTSLIRTWSFLWTPRPFGNPGSDTQFGQNHRGRHGDYTVVPFCTLDPGNHIHVCPLRQRVSEGHGQQNAINRTEEKGMKSRKKSKKSNVRKANSRVEEIARRGHESLDRFYSPMPLARKKLENSEYGLTAPLDGPRKPGRPKGSVSAASVLASSGLARASKARK